MLKLTWAVVFCLAPAFASAFSPTENAHGVIVKFRSTQKNTFKTRDLLHKQLTTQLVYRPRRSPFDFVVPQSADEQRDFSALAKLCETYRTNAAVADCEISYDLFAHNQNTPTPAPAGLASGSPACVLTPSHNAPLLMGGTLSAFWAQELTGADLVVFPRGTLRLGVQVRVGVIDQGYGAVIPTLKNKVIPSVFSAPGSSNTHAALTLGLITGPAPYSVQPPIEVTHLFEVRNTADYLKVWETLETARHWPDVLQISVDLGGSSSLVREVLTNLSKKMILVAAADSNWPAPPEENELKFPGIVISSVSPQGYPSANADMQDVSASVPSDLYIQSTVDGKKPSTFGSTSGASALAAGVIAAARSLVADLTADDIKLILKHTALGAAGYRQQVGTLNAVRALATVDRIRSLNLISPAREKSLADPKSAIFQFEKEAATLAARAAEDLDNPKLGCADRTKAYERLRRAFFLNPLPTYRAAWIRSLNDQGLTSNARFLVNQDPAALLASITNDISSEDPRARQQAARASVYMGAKGWDLLVRYAEQSSRSPASTGQAAADLADTAAAVENLAGLLDEDSRKKLLFRLRNHDNPSVKKLSETLGNASKSNALKNR